MGEFTGSHSVLRKIMNRRMKASRGQALVLVTLSFIAMAGLMGLAVDLGWSFFVQKQAQAAADGAALAAAQEAVTRLGGGGAGATGFTCATAGTGAGSVDCQTTPISCSSVISTSNLNNGCKYALSNGFNWTGSSRQNVTIQSNDGQPADLPPTAPGVKNLSYWVTVRTVQTIPQLFSAVLGNTQGTVSAVATAAIAASVKPGSFYGMNRAGDCLTPMDGTATAVDCGLDVSTGSGKGGMTCPGAPSNNANLCAPAGIILASSCNAVGAGCSQAYAGTTKGGANAYGSSLVVMSNGAVAGGGWNPSTPTWTSNANTFDDPTAGKSQPPILTPANSMGTCGIPHASGTTAVITGGTMGPFLYYAYSNSSGQPIPDGAPIQISGTATFSSSATSCPSVLSGTMTTAQGGNTAAQGGSAFPTYVFYGGVVNNGTMNLGPGQYVMAGVKSAPTTGLDASSNPATVFSNPTNKSVVQPDPAQPAAVNTGTMFIFTDSNYPGLNLPNNFNTLNQGTLYVKNGDLTMSGLVDPINSTSQLPSSMSAYSGVVWWQDRRNSEVGYDEPGAPGCAGCSTVPGTVNYCNIGCVGGTVPASLTAANHVTNTSPGVIMDPGNGNIALKGVYYQPRGAWLDFVAGTTGSLAAALQTVRYRL